MRVEAFRLAQDSHRGATIRANSANVLPRSERQPSARCHGAQLPEVLMRAGSARSPRFHIDSEILTHDPTVAPQASAIRYRW